MTRTAARRGTILVLTLIVFVVLLIMGLAYHRVTQGVRRSAVRTYYRLHATTALENALLEGANLFVARVNQAGIEYRRPEAAAAERQRQAEARRRAAAGGNDSAFAAFLGRHGGQVSARVAVAGEQDDGDVVAGGADPWYEAFRSRTASFKEACPVPYARQLMGRAHDGMSFDELRIRVVEVEDGDPKERFVLRRGLVSLSATGRVAGDRMALTRSMERRYRFVLQKVRAPSWVGGGEYSKVQLEQPPVATFLELHGNEDDGA